MSSELSGRAIVALRPVVSADRDQILGWRNLASVAQNMYTDHVITSDEHDRWFERALGDPTRRDWVIVFEGRDVGLATLYNIDEHNRKCSWAFYLGADDVRGKGVGGSVERQVLAHVFQVLNLNKLCCEVLTVNEPVIAMHKRFGFTEEGCLRQHIWKNGDAFDVTCLSILKSEWERIGSGSE